MWISFKKCIWPGTREHIVSIFVLKNVFWIKLQDKFQKWVGGGGGLQNLRKPNARLYKRIVKLYRFIHFAGFFIWHRTIKIRLVGWCLTEQGIYNLSISVAGESQRKIRTHNIVYPWFKFYLNSVLSRIWTLN